MWWRAAPYGGVCGTEGLKDRRCNELKVGRLAPLAVHLWACKLCKPPPQDPHPVYAYVSKDTCLERLNPTFVMSEPQSLRMSEWMPICTRITQATLNAYRRDSMQEVWGGGSKRTKQTHRTRRAMAARGNKHGGIHTRTRPKNRGSPGRHCMTLEHVQDCRPPPKGGAQGGNTHAHAWLHRLLRPPHVAQQPKSNHTGT